MKNILLLSTIMMILVTGFSQTPGMIIKPAMAPGNSVLDPDLDGYVSAKTDGVQLGFTIPPDNDVLQSEIPYVPIIKPDPTADLLRGPVGGFIEIVGVDAAGNNAIMIYSDGSCILFRFRLGGYAPNTKSYSLLLDTDQKFGFTGINADPNAVVGNAGFEAEIVLSTNFSVDVYNVNGLSSNGVLVKSYSYDTNCQKSMAVSTAGGDPDYFYDFYVKESDVSSLFTGSTPLRIVGLTTMNNMPAIGNNALSDVGGNNTGSNPDAIFEELIEAQTPTAPGGEVLDRTACPTIDPVISTATEITGSSTEPSGTNIKVYVYQSNGVILIGNGTTLTIGTSWSINVSALGLPGGTLVKDYVVKATATAIGKGTSYDNCSIKTVTSCISPTAIPTALEVTKISGSKGYDIALSVDRPIGTLVYLYTSNYSLRTVSDLKNGVTNPFLTTTSPQTFSFECQTGNCFGSDVYYFRYEEPNYCISPYYVSCDYATGGTANTPSITTSTITTSTTVISGTGTQASSQILLYADGNQIASTTSSTTAPYSWSIPVSGLSICQVLTARQIVSGKCISNPTTGITVSRTAYKPVITSGGCNVTPPTTISGYSTEIGSIVTLYRTSPSTTTLGTCLVQPDGSWSISGLTLATGNVLTATVSSGACLTASANSDPITILTQTNILDYTLEIDNPLETANTITGSIVGGTYPVTLIVYIDQTQIGSGVTVTGAGTWEVSVPTSELYIGGTIQVSLTSASNCESSLSLISGTVECVPPSTAIYTSDTYLSCYGNAGSITLPTSQSGIVYQLVNSTGQGVGPSSIGTGSGITLYTNVLTADLLDIYVKTYKIGYSTCTVTSSDPINFKPELATPSLTLASTSISVEKGTTTSVDLPYLLKSTSPSADTYTIDYSVAANHAGFNDITTEMLIPLSPQDITLSVPIYVPVGTYTGTIIVYSNAPEVECSQSYGFTLTVYSGNTAPTISLDPANVNICSGSSASLNVTASSSSAISYQWQSSSTYTGTYTDVSTGTGGTTTNYITTTLTSTTFFRVIVTNSIGSTISHISTVTVSPVPGAAGILTGVSTICSGESDVPYSISTISAVTSYNWSYSGAEVVINGTNNSITMSFSPDATSGTLSVAGTNSCGGGTKSEKIITVHSTPDISSITTTSCSGTAFAVTPVDGINGTVPPGTTYSWDTPVITGGMTGGISGSGLSTIGGTLVNITSSTQTATYTVTPTAESCTGNTFTITVSVNPQINLTATPIAALCNGGSTGRIDLILSGGTPSYSYLWTGPDSFTATTQNLSGLKAGTYNLTVTDSRSCISTTSATVNQPDETDLKTDLTNVSCHGGSTGEIALTVTGGTNPYTYLWNDGSSAQNRTGLIAGTFSVSVIDANECNQTLSGITITQPDDITISGSKTNLACYGELTGAINITVTGGTLPYAYDWEDITGANNDEDRSDLTAGTYQIIVTDAHDCKAIASYTITQPSMLSLSTTITNDTCPDAAKGAINLTISGGTREYTYDWTDLSTPAEPEDRTDLTAKSYTVNVTDSNGCEATTTATIININPNPVTPGTISK